MAGENRFLTSIALAAAGATALYLPLAYLAELATRGHFLSPDTRLAIVAAMAVIPCPLAAWWLFRKLRPILPLREARAIAVSSAVCSAICFQPAIFHSQDRGMPADRVLGTPLFWPAMFLTVAAMEIAANIIICVFVLWTLRTSFRGRPKA